MVGDSKGSTHDGTGTSILPLGCSRGGSAGPAGCRSSIRSDEMKAARGLQFLESKMLYQFTLTRNDVESFEDLNSRGT